MYLSPDNTGCPDVLLVKLGMTTASITRRRSTGGSDGKICLASEMRPVRWRRRRYNGFTNTPSPVYIDFSDPHHRANEVGRATQHNIGLCRICTRDTLSWYLEFNISFATPIAYPVIMNFSAVSIHSHNDTHTCLFFSPFSPFQGWRNYFSRPCTRGTLIL